MRLGVERRNRRPVRAPRRIARRALGEGAFGPGPAIWAGRREIAHLDRDGRLDVRLTRAEIRSRREVLVADRRVTLRPVTSDWVAFAVTGPGDVEDAVALVNAALAANLPSAEPGPPPTGAEVERRRRFH